MNENLIIIGAGGHGKVCLDIALEMKRWKDIYFLDDYCQEKEILGHKVLGTTDLIDKYKENYDFFVGIGDNEIRSKILNNLIDKNFNIATLIHPKAIISRFVTIGEGTVVMPGVIVNANVMIGIGNIINTGSSVDHDCKLMDFIHLSPGTTLGGKVKIESYTWLGLNTSVVNDQIIGGRVTTGSSSNVINELLEGKIYIGNPAKEKNAT